MFLPNFSHYDKLNYHNLIINDNPIVHFYIKNGECGVQNWEMEIESMSQN